MQSQELEQKVIHIVAKTLGLDEEEVSADSSYKDLNTDSLDSVEIVMDLEEEFGFLIPDDDAQSLQSVAETIEYVQEKVS